MTNLRSIFAFENELWIVMCFKALTCIKEIDEVIYRGYVGKFKDRMEKNLDSKLPIEPPKYELTTDESKGDGYTRAEPKLGKIQRMGSLMVDILMQFNEVVYFYFFPLLALLYMTFILQELNGPLE